MMEGRATAETSAAEETPDAALAVLTVHHWPARSRGFAELERVLRPGGQLTFTILGDKAVTLHDFGPDASSRFAAGELLYEATGAGEVRPPDVYGWTAIPETWLHSNLAGFTIEDVTDDETVCEQVVVTARRLS